MIAARTAVIEPAAPPLAASPEVRALLSRAAAAAVVAALREMRASREEEPIENETKDKGQPVAAA